MDLQDDGPEVAPATLAQLRQTALVLLSKREYSRHELRQRLRTKHPAASAERLQQVLDELQSQNLQSDLRYSLTLLRSKMQRGYGFQFVNNLLSQQQIPQHLIDLAIAELEPDWFSLVIQVYQRKYSQSIDEWPVDSDAGRKERARRQRFLYYRGFTAEQIQYALEQGHKT